ncbi:interferon lambda-3-like [Pseudophryne corroboree]|uniref:interferon lambda-3-like n=1 Tax=Pseudophryne corroboree TaxID=495146 RepID=UPI0030812AF6
MDVRLVAVTVLAVAVSGSPHGRRCHVSRYLSVSPTDITALRQLQGVSEKDLSSKAMRCYRRMMKHKPSVCDLEPSDRLILTLERVSLAADVLTSMSSSALSDAVSQSLMAFLTLRDDLMICRESPEYREPASKRLRPWLQRLQRFKKAASQACVRNAVLLSLLSLRVEDVSCWAIRNMSLKHRKGER